MLVSTFGDEGKSSPKVKSGIICKKKKIKIEKK